MKYVKTTKVKKHVHARGKRVTRGFMLWNKTDGIAAWPEPFKTKRDALKFACAFRARYAQQGYYLTADGQRIDPKDVILMPRPAEP